MGITESINYHLNKLELEVDEEDLANGSINPKYRTVRYWYDKWRSVNLGSRFGKGMLEKIQDKQPQYTGKGVTIKVEEDPFTAVIVTQIMRRAHILYCAGDIVFVESTESCDAENHSITFMLTVCSAGAVPLAVIINKGQSKRDYIAGFKMKEAWKTVDNGFNAKVSVGGSILQLQDKYKN
ncbi:uncharacterized protein LOC130896669 [Diorhabda carinulata]|uniref:uncharacterized protein LOC130896669 n=1 Tax=Diorhabda carinulata TaxID=1163345 RepID=UPI0025A28E4A|nr:uncharacterized protein LOC130896669 [Diorhabda carinulata]